MKIGEQISCLACRSIFGSVFCLVLLVSQARAEEYKNEEAVRAGAEEAMKLISEGKVAQAIDGLKKYWPLSSTEVDGLSSQIEKAMTVYSSRFGDSVGTEVLSERKVGKSFFQIQYLQKFSRHALIWTFRFYSPKNTWLLNSVNYSDKIQELFANPRFGGEQN